MAASLPLTLWRATRAIIAVLAMLALIGIWRLLPPRGRLGRGMVRLIWRVLLAGFGLEVRVHGTPLAAPGVLHVANHVSWTDIPVLGLVINAGFVAKHEVADWPVIGPGAARIGCLFVARERRGEVALQAGGIAARLAAGESVILFAEGTTGVGTAVLPFRSSLFDIGAAPVQPVTIAARNRDGTAFAPTQRRRFAWIDDDELLPHAQALALSPGAVVDVYFEEPILTGDRKQRALASRAAIVSRLESVQAATLNRAA